MTSRFLFLALLFGCGVGPSALESEECDPELGVHACGAGLFCGQFDDRTVPTCYAERSRDVGESCEEDDHCASQRCVDDKCEAPDGSDADQCAAELIGPSKAQSELCDPAYGIDACGAGLFCAAFDGRVCGTCYRARGQYGGQECAADEHCANLNCVDGKCAPASTGSPCLVSADCTSGNCSCNIGSAVFAECCSTP